MLFFTRAREGARESGGNMLMLNVQKVPGSK
jgi:hypothetical protein